MLEKIKGINRALLELVMGILFLGIIIQIAGFFLAEAPLKFSIAMWLGIAAAIASAVHMYVSLDRALSMGAGAYGAATKSAMIRYFCWALFLGIMMATKVLNPVHGFIGLLTLKVAAYLQPFTHRFCNFIFQETDPIPEAIPWEDER
ncbi:MAG: hypothetical protein IJ324_00600 [Lachnospiraceae bacterium]|nr:hypothetical protein [Lachnospiraceae bacterium]